MSNLETILLNAVEAAEQNCPELFEKSAIEIFDDMLDYDSDLQQWESQLCEVLNDAQLEREKFKARVILVQILMSKGL